MRRRRSDVRDLDPVGSLRFPVVDALHDLPADGFAHDDELVLAALAADVCSDAVSDTQSAVDLASRLGRTSDADRVADLVSDAYLVRAAATRLGTFDEPALLQLAAHLASPVHARQTFTLARALGELPRRLVEALDELHELIRDALDHPEITGTGAGNVAGARLQAAVRLAPSPEVVDRLRHASTTFLLAHDPVELARQAQLVEPIPRSGVVRVAVSPQPEPDTWTIDVGCRDAPGLLARLTGVLVSAGLEVTDAAIATWPDGAVLDTFLARGTRRPGARELAMAMEAALRQPLPRRVVPGLEITFDADAMPWHTTCTVRGPDQPGVLEAIAVAFAAAEVVVHTARISSADGQIRDRFTVSDRVGRKLDAAMQQRVTRALAGERVGRRRFPFTRRG
jgi:[protein-PII] uridylyltransferase